MDSFINRIKKDLSKEFSLINEPDYTHFSRFERNKVRHIFLDSPKGVAKRRIEFNLRLIRDWENLINGSILEASSGWLANLEELVNKNIKNKSLQDYLIPGTYRIKDYKEGFDFYFTAPEKDYCPQFGTYISGIYSLRNFITEDIIYFHNTIKGVFIESSKREIIDHYFDDRYKKRQLVMLFTLAKEEFVKFETEIKNKLHIK